MEQELSAVKQALKSELLSNWRSEASTIVTKYSKLAVTAVLGALRKQADDLNKLVKTASTARGKLSTKKLNPKHDAAKKMIDDEKTSIKAAYNGYKAAVAHAVANAKRALFGPAGLISVMFLKGCTVGEVVYEVKQYLRNAKNRLGLPSVLTAEYPIVMRDGMPVPPRRTSGVEREETPDPEGFEMLVLTDSFDLAAEARDTMGADDVVDLARIDDIGSDDSGYDVNDDAMSLYGLSPRSKPVTGVQRKVDHVVRQAAMAGVNSSTALVVKTDDTETQPTKLSLPIVTSTEPLALQCDGVESETESYRYYSDNDDNDFDYGMFA